MEEKEKKLLIRAGLVAAWVYIAIEAIEIILKLCGVFQVEEKKRGRPTEKPLVLRLHIRIDEETNFKLEEICKITNKGKSDVLREEINKLYEEIKKGQ